MLQRVKPAGKTVGERLTESLQALTAQEQSKQFGTPHTHDSSDPGGIRPARPDELPN